MGVALIGIYASMGIAQEVAAGLRERGLLGTAGVLFLIVVAGIVLAEWVRRPPGIREVGIALGIAFVYLWTLARMFVPEERTHLIEYSIVALFMHRALVERRRNGRPVPLPAVITIVAVALLGLLDEAVQWFVPGRHFDLHDVGFNVLAGLMATTASVAVAAARRLDIRWRDRKP